MSSDIRSQLQQQQQQQQREQKQQKRYQEQQQNQSTGRSSLPFPSSSISGSKYQLLLLTVCSPLIFALLI